MTHEQLMVKLFQFSSPTYYKWKKHENRPIFDLLDRYFSKEDLEEYVKTGEIAKFGSPKNNIFTNHIRTDEIIKLLEKSNIKLLSISLAENIEKFNDISGTTKLLRLNESPIEFLRDLEKILLDSKSETKNVSYAFRYAVEGFNEDIGFDFSHTDTNIIRSIISRYKVYNTLYDLDKIPTKD